MEVGANYQNNKCDFVVWAPDSTKVEVVLNATNEKYPMNKFGIGYWKLVIDGIRPESEYMFELNGRTLLPDPASHFQPKGVFGPSKLINHGSFKWTDNDWHGLSLKDMIFYELHVGTFTPEGTFKAILSRVKELSEVGLNAIELMPIAQFSGKRNWGYDVAFPFAVQNTYGSPGDLKNLANECHNYGISLFVDVVYNHAGPEGNFLNEFGPYFMKNRITAWGPTVNLDGPNSKPIRDYFMQNTFHWLQKYHLDGLRLDAVLFMIDKSPVHFLQDLTTKVKISSRKLKRKIWLIAESGYNEPIVLTPRNRGGYGFDAQWLDDFQHALHAVLTGEKEGYYRNYGKMLHLKDTLIESYVHVGGGLPYSNFHRRDPGESFLWINSNKLVVFSQNHDQVGNRVLSERLATLSGYEAAKTAAGLVLFSPYVPLLFMGEEYGETKCFNFFVDYADAKLNASARKGRALEFASFHWKGESRDPSALETFEDSRINWQSRYTGIGAEITNYYKALIHLRKNMKQSCYSNRGQMEVLCDEEDKILFIKRCKDSYANVVVANLGDKEQNFEFPFNGEKYGKVLDSADINFGGSGAILPNEVKRGEKNSIHGFNFAVFEGNPVPETIV
jgi:maltooligosyltrehalose trehalohydrolase